MSWLIRAGLLSALALWGSSASAEEAPMLVSLQWSRLPGAEGCITRQQLQTEVEARLERSVFVAPGQANMRVEGTIASVPEGEWVASFEARDRAGKSLGVRVVRSRADACGELNDALALVMAVAIESARPQVTLRVPPPRPPRRAAPAAPLEPWQAKVAPSGWAAVGLLPGVGFGAGLHAVVEPPRWVPMEFDVTGYFPRREQREDRGAEFLGWHAGLVACPSLHDGGALRLGLCGGMQAGVLQAAGFGLPVTRQVRSTMFNGVARGLVELRAGHVVPRLGLALVIPAVRDRFVFELDGEPVELHRPSAAVLQLDLGVGFAVP